MICTECSQHNNDDVKFCRHCGAQIERRVCPNGHTIPEGLSACPYCPKGREKTVVEAPPAAAGAPAAGAGRKGTVVVSPEQLQASGVAAEAPVPAFEHQVAVGSAKPRSKTMVGVPGAEPAGGAGSAAAPAAAPAAAAMSGMVHNTGASPLAGFLVSSSQDANGVFWPLRYGRTRIGSGADNDIVLPFADISGEHSQVNVRDNKGTPKIWCSDSNSTNGTLLNGDDIFTERPDIATGDVIKIGPVELRVLLLDS